MKMECADRSQITYEQTDMICFRRGPGRCKHIKALHDILEIKCNH